MTRWPVEFNSPPEAFASGLLQGDDKMETKDNKPALECRFGGVRATVWRRESAKGAFHVVTFSRRYRQDGTWREADSFSFREMAALSVVLKQARAWMRAQGETD
jgi:hypothetical protein